jgi:alpha/beta hydrolase fold
MKIYSILLLAIVLAHPRKGQSQLLDTLVDVGGHRLHFHVLKGQGVPILFESGGGNDGTVWQDLLSPVETVTRTTLIPYDRAGFGTSELDTNQHDITSSVQDLGTGLKKLGYDGPIILVAHSLGGFYATLYAATHPDRVKAAVLIDANLSCFYTDARTVATQRSNNEQMNSFRLSNPGVYYIYRDITNTTTVMKTAPFPSSIPVIDIVSDKTPFSDSVDRLDWKDCHRGFAAEATNRTGIVADGTGHYIFPDNPSLVVQAIIQAYGKTLPKDSLLGLFERAATYALGAANEAKRVETASRHSENDLNSWGYDLLRQGKTEGALTIFQLNTRLYPESWNVYDSYGEALLKVGRKTEAIAMYKKSVALNPGNDNGKKVLEGLQR